MPYGPHVADDLPARGRRFRLHGERDADADCERQDERGDEEREPHGRSRDGSLPDTLGRCPAACDA